jgi:predicted ATPase/DNA-binding winged helix-turn-helix (wHTH) protein
LWQGSQQLPVRPKPFAVLAYLAVHAGRLVPRAELVKAVWPDTHVSAAVLRGYIRDLRIALGDDPETPRFVQTLAHRGYRFVGPIGDASASIRMQSARAASREPGQPALAGREAELARLHEWLNKAMQGSRQLVFVTGEPGIGKTTLLDTFLAQAVDAGRLRFARGQCVEHFGVGEVYLPVLEALGQLCRQEGGEEIVALMCRHAPTWLIEMPGLVGDDELEAVRRRAHGATRERMLRELAETLEVLTAETPLGLVIEDLQWCDFSTLDLISSLAQRRGRARLLVVGTYRPGDAIINRHPVRTLKQELRVRGNCEELALGPLTSKEVSQYLAARFESQPTSAALTRLIHQATDGNPLFMVNLVDYWVAQGILAQDHGHWRLTTVAADARAAVPESLRQMIETQLERLAPQERRMLEAASVAGREFSLTILATVLEEKISTVEQWCEELFQRDQFLRPCGTENLPDQSLTARYRFIHALYQQVLYERIAEVRRIELHRQLGQRLEAIYGGRKDEPVAELAVHFERGRCYEQAVRYLWRAVDNANRRHAPEESAALLSKGLEVLKNLPESTERAQQELALCIALGVPLLMTKGYAAPEVQQTYARARELCQQLGDEPQLLPALAGLFRFYFMRAQFQTARQLAEQVLRIAQRTSDRFALMAAHSMLGVSRLNLGEIAAAHKELELGISLYHLQEHRHLSMLYGEDPAVVCLSFAGMALWFLGLPDQALHSSQQAVKLAEELSIPYSRVFALSFAAWIHVRRREPGAAQTHLAMLRTLAIEHGFTFFLAEGSILEGWVLAEQGSSEEGITRMREGLAAYRASGAEMGRPSHLALLADACARIGRTREGLDAVAEALAAVEKTGERTYEAELYRLKGELGLQSGMRKSSSRLKARSAVRRNSNRIGSESAARDFDSEAESYFRRAIQLAVRRQEKSLELRAVMSLSRFLSNCGKGKAARRILTEVCGRFTEGFDSADMKDARSLLAGKPARSARQHRIVLT